MRNARPRSYFTGHEEELAAERISDLKNRSRKEKT